MISSGHRCALPLKSALGGRLWRIRELELGEYVGVDLKAVDPDFRVKYRFFSEEEGGRKTLPFQGYRCDFCYAGEDPRDGIYMIWPEFLDADGEVLAASKAPVAKEGTANMLIVMPQMRQSVHLGKLKVGIRGFFMEGGRKVGEVEVLEILAIAENVRMLIDR